MKNTVDFYSKNADYLVEQYEKITTEVIHKDWFHLIPDTKSLILDIGAGSGRDAAWLAKQGHEVIAVEPADRIREKAKKLHPLPAIQWVKDTMPSLKKVSELELKFDLILLSAVWMHINTNDRKRTFRKLTNLLKPGGKLIITLRHGPTSDERVIYPVSSEELRQFANRFALEVILDKESRDQLNRPEVSWTTVAFWLPDDGTGALPLLRHVIINDAKSSTYKLALLRILLRIADGAQGSVLKKTKDHVSLPFGLVALYWVRAYKPLLMDVTYLQQPYGSKKLGFDKKAFRSLADISPYDLRIGTRFEGDNAENMIVALRDARNTIKNMPSFYTTYPNSNNPVFLCESKQIRKRNFIKLDFDFLAEFGVFKVPLNLWDSMTRYACWIEPAILNEWCELMAGYDAKIGKRKTLDKYMKALSWLDEKRDTREIRTIVEYLKARGTSIYCVWTGKRLKNDYSIDHCFPFGHWPNNDLWNLMPTHPRVNNSKSDKLPSAMLLVSCQHKNIG